MIEEIQLSDNWKESLVEMLADSGLCLVEGVGCPSSACCSCDSCAELIFDKILRDARSEGRAEGYTEGRQDVFEEVLDSIGYADSVKECMEFVEVKE